MLSTADWLGKVARDLNQPDPSEHLGAAVAAAFPLPPDDPRQADNALAPGGPPLELSFSEKAPQDLRLALELGGPDCTAAERRRLSWALARRLAQPWSDPNPEPPSPKTGPAYGAMLGLVLSPAGLRSVKVYEESGPDEPLPPALSTLRDQTTAKIAGLRPLFWSQSWQAEGPQQRLYLIADAGLSFFDLDALGRGLGEGRAVAALCAAARPFGGRGFGIDRGRAVLGLRPRPDGSTALKLDLLYDATLPEQAEAWARVERRLSAGPVSTAWAGWKAALQAPGWTGGLGAVGWSAETGTSPALTVYWRPRAK